MGRDQGPLVTRRWMIAGTAVALAALLAGCGGNANVQANSNNGAVSGSVSLPGRTTLGTLLSIVFLAGVSYESDREMARSERVPYGAHSSYPAPVPDLDPSRRVVEHDCTRQIEDWSANLRCR
jgi:hypothetical protein